MKNNSIGQSLIVTQIMAAVSEKQMQKWWDVVVAQQNPLGRRLGWLGGLTKCVTDTRDRSSLSIF